MQQNTFWQSRVGCKKIYNDVKTQKITFVVFFKNNINLEILSRGSQKLIASTAKGNDPRTCLMLDTTACGINFQSSA